MDTTAADDILKMVGETAQPLVHLVPTLRRYIIDWTASFLVQVKLRSKLETAD